MQRDKRLRGLSSEHHHALRLARRVAEACRGEGPDEDLAHEVDREWQQQLGPHFTTEEELLLPGLAKAGEAEMAERIRGDHARLRDHLRAALAGELSRLASFAELLHQHVRFEERVLFPACEELLDPATLEQVFQRHPHHR